MTRTLRSLIGAAVIASTGTAGHPKALAAGNDVAMVEVTGDGARYWSRWRGPSGQGIAAPGKTYFDLREALSFFGLDDDALRRFGIRLFQVRMPFPLEPETAREFGRGLEEVVVLEEKRPFLELFLKEALYHERLRPRIVGKPLVPAEGALDADAIAQILVKRLAPYVPQSRLESRLGVLGFLREGMEEPLPTSRLFHFCSGCPHNRSTNVPEGSFASAGIGCHGMAMLMDRSTASVTTWAVRVSVGGDGAFHRNRAPLSEPRRRHALHSGTLAIRQAVASGEHHFQDSL
jgi:indolepyruvate ferredoxin oxidoreductase